MLTLYGLKACDTCRKALKSLEAAGLSPVFVDVRADPLGADQLKVMLEALGEGLLNTRSTTWRGLSEAERARAPLALLQAHPTLMKRPVIDHDGTLSLGWTAKVQASLGL